jgi:5'-phosphate synthase pdxT subunit
VSAVIGVLALQGGVAPHLHMLQQIGLPARRVRDGRELQGLSGLVLPGGESTAQKKLLARFGLGAVLDAHVQAGRPVLATCAGLILAAERGYLDARVERNAYGPHVRSFEASTDDGALRMRFIRAPRLRSLGPDVQVIARVDGEPVVVQQGAVIASSGHPELSGVAALHRLAFVGNGA